MRTDKIEWFKHPSGGRYAAIINGHRASITTSPAGRKMSGKGYRVRTPNNWQYIEFYSTLASAKKAAEKYCYMLPKGNVK